jgi:2-keto-4-pentenoate hydratase/2-oxohepta-3-ene-1,7-dioic acid hydratase in catechol pathway
MKIVVYGPMKRTGILRDGEVIDLAGAYAKYLREKEGEQNAAIVADALAPSDLGRLIEGGRRALDNANTALDYLLSNAGDRTGVHGEELIHQVDAVVLHAPRPTSGRVACAGGNFPEHSIAMAQRRVERGEANPIQGSARDYVRNRGFWGFWKVDRESLGQDGKVPYPARCTRLDYEGEVAVVFGKEGKNIKAGDFDAHVWGVTLLGDWSIRMSPEHGPMVFAMQKNFDNSCSIGPCIVVDELDPLNVEIETLVNGESRQKYNSGDMAFSYGEYAEYLSRDFTFYPGDMLSGGTGAGTAADSSQTGDDGKPLPDRFLKPGDQVDITSPAIGTLRTAIVESDAG